MWNTGREEGQEVWKGAHVELESPLKHSGWDVQDAPG